MATDWPWKWGFWRERGAPQPTPPTPRSAQSSPAVVYLINNSERRSRSWRLFQPYSNSFCLSRGLTTPFDGYAWKLGERSGLSVRYRPSLSEAGMKLSKLRSASVQEAWPIELKLLPCRGDLVYLPGEMFSRPLLNLARGDEQGHQSNSQSASISPCSSSKGSCVLQCIRTCINAPSGLWKVGPWDFSLSAPHSAIRCPRSS